MPAPDQMQPPSAAQTHAECLLFIEAFAKVTVNEIRATLGRPSAEVAAAETGVAPDWDSPELLTESGIALGSVDAAARQGTKYLHIEVAMNLCASQAVALLLAFTGLSEKQRRTLFPVLSSRQGDTRERTAEEVKRLNAWLEWVRQGDFDPSAFVTYQRGLGVHGRTQNLTGSIGATGAAIAFLDVIKQADSTALVSSEGSVPPPSVRSPQQIAGWWKANATTALKAILLRNGRALVFASSKDANIFMPLDGPYTDAADALRRFNEVRNDASRRRQKLHEFAVGEVKTATDLANLHERMGLASRETQTELRTDRFLMMSVLNREILEGGVQRRVMNNRDLTRFSHVFNLHHCWGWDGGRERHPDHWAYFVRQVREWCGL